MRILLANSRYFVSAGPERYMFNITDMLERHGHEVVPFSVRYTRNEPSPWADYFVPPIAGEDAVYYRDHGHSPRSVARGLERAFYSREVYEGVQRLVRAQRPDAAIVLHFLRKLSPSVLVALKEAGVPVIVRLSDFGMLCPEQHMLRDGSVCRLCITDGLRSSIRYRCVHKSFSVSAMACASTWYWRWRKYFDLVDRFIVPSSIMGEEMVQGGYDPSRIVVLPTFVQAGLFNADGTRERYIAHVGRLAPEKGVHILLEAYARLLRQEGLGDIELHIAGGGEDAYASEIIARGRSISPQVRFLGMLDTEALRNMLSGAMLSVVPSMWYENCPNSILESLAAGTPVVASNLGSMAEMLGGTDAGLLFRPGDSHDLANQLESVLRGPDTLAHMSRAARELAETRYSPATHLAGLMRVLEGIVTTRGGSVPNAK